MKVINVKLSFWSIYYHVGINREGTMCHIKAFYRAVVFCLVFQNYDVCTNSALDVDTGNRNMTCKDVCVYVINTQPTSHLHKHTQASHTTPIKITYGFGSDGAAE